MKAAVRDSYGGPEVVRVEDVPTPTPGDDEVLVRVQAASVNRADLDVLRPLPAITRVVYGIRRPRTRAVGCDVAGVVEAVGPGVTRFAPGDRVFADLYPFGMGAFAELATAPERAFQPIPDALSIEEAATLPHSGILALQGLRAGGGRAVGGGDRVLIIGASGNVGPFAVQIAKALGAEVTGVCSTGKIDLVRSLGADHVVDYTRVDDPTSGERYDWILDTAGHHSILGARRSLRPGGVYVTLGGSTRSLLEAITLGPVVSLATGKRTGLMFWWRPFRREDVEALTALVASGAVRPVIDRRYPLADVREALEHVDAGRAIGKVLVIP